MTQMSRQNFCVGKSCRTCNLYSLISVCVSFSEEEFLLVNNCIPRENYIFRNMVSILVFRSYVWFLRKRLDFLNFGIFFFRTMHVHPWSSCQKGQSSMRVQTHSGRTYLIHSPYASSCAPIATSYLLWSPFSWSHDATHSGVPVGLISNDTR